MKEKSLIIYSLQEKSNAERSRILQKLYGYRDNSNYSYSYERSGMLNSIPHQKFKKIVLEIGNKKDLSKVAEILKSLNVKFEIAKV